MRLSDCVRFYQKPGVAQELIRLAEGREVGVSFGLNKFGKRPSILQMPGDIKNLVRQGATSFHISEERWSNPMNLSAESTQKETADLRAGWDLVLDIDLKNFEASKAVAQLLIKALNHHDISSASVKFSGNKGFHIGVPWEAIPQDYLKQYPEVAQLIAQYLVQFIKPNIERKILELCGNDLKKVSELLNIPRENLIKKETGEFQENVLSQIDIGLMSPRHLFRSAYSLNEKSGLVSVTINPNEIESFEKKSAEIDNIKEINDLFLNAEKTKAGEAAQLVVQALDWQKRAEEKGEVKNLVSYEGKVPKEAFPPCMKLILNGLDDGKKRALFALLNFLRKCNWSWEEIEAEIKDWNKRNPKPLKEGYIKSQLTWHKRQSQEYPPPNCRRYFIELGVCKPDNICDRIKNPVSYPWWKLKSASKKT